MLLPGQRARCGNQCPRAGRRLRSDPGGADQGVWTLGSYEGCLSWGAVVRAKAGRAAGAQREGGPEGEFDAPNFSGPSDAEAWRTHQGSSRLGGGHAVPSPHVPASPCCGQRPPPWLPPPSSLLPGLPVQGPQLPAEMGVIRLEGDVGSDYLGWKLAPCVFFHPAQDWGGGEQLLHRHPGRANFFTDMFETRV